MKKFLALLLVAHLILETLASTTFVFNPESLIANPDPQSLFVLVNLGAVVFAVGLVALWVWPYRANVAALSVGLGVLATFHTIATFTGLHFLLQGMDGSAMYIHGVLGLCFWFLWVKRQTLAA